MAEAGQKRPAGQIKGAVQELAQDVATLCTHPVYISTIAGQTLYTGALLLSLQGFLLSAHCGKCCVKDLLPASR